MNNSILLVTVMSESFKSFKDAAKFMKDGIQKEGNKDNSVLARNKRKYAQSEPVVFLIENDEKPHQASDDLPLMNNYDTENPESIEINEGVLFVRELTTYEKEQRIKCPKHNNEIIPVCHIATKSEQGVLMFCEECNNYYMKSHMADGALVGKYKNIDIVSIMVDKTQIKEPVQKSVTKNGTSNNGREQPKEKKNPPKLSKTKVENIKKEVALSPLESETTHLDNTIYRIDEKIEQLTGNVSKLQADLFYMPTNEVEDLIAKREAMDEIERRKGYAKEYYEMRPQPYFGRMDFSVYNDDLYTEESYYIGRNNFDDIIDWRSPVAQFFYQKTQNSFNYNNYKYDLNLRRALNIKNSKLISINTEYERSKGTEDNNSEIVDPFLIEVLNDKRRERRLTDIIQTIQQKQIEIIRYPKEKSFIVQGCAGSGKTMILLHRLSYMKYNNPKMSWKPVKIITPNDFFDKYIEDLSSQLELTDIDRLSVDEYYVDIIKRYNSQYNFDSKVKSESSLDINMLTELYSMPFIDSFAESFATAKRNKFDQLKSTDYQHISEQLERRDRWPDENDMSYQAIDRIKNNISLILSDIAERELKYKKAKQECQDDAYLTKEEDVIKAHRILSNAYDATKNEIHTKYTEASRIVDEYKESEEQLSLKKADIQGQISKLKDELSHLDTVIAGIDSLDEANIRFLKENCPEIKSILEMELDDLVLNLANLKVDYDKTSSVNFTKRNRIKRDILQLEDDINQKKYLLEEFRNQNVAKHNDIRTKIEELEKELQKIRDNAQEGIRDLISDALFYESLYILFSGEEFPYIVKRTPGGRDGLLSDEDAKYNQIVERYVSAYDAYKSTEKSFAAANRRREAHNQQLREAEANLATTEQISAIRQANGYIEQLESSRFCQFVCTEVINKLHIKYGVHVSSNTYHHNLFLLLMSYYLYYGPCRSGDTWVNIDEAQDLALSEYVLLRNIFGEDCVFNLYGDLNQAVYEYKGIDDWNVLGSIISSKQFELNENYRNTIQITDYCNNVFDAAVYPIGVSGEDVIQTDIIRALDAVTVLQETNPDYRIAVIHSHKENFDSLKKSYPINPDLFTLHKVVEGKIAILNVEEAKGLEFDSVVVLLPSMEVNEEYIAYTRALDNLYICK